MKRWLAFLAAGVALSATPAAAPHHRRPSSHPSSSDRKKPVGTCRKSSLRPHDDTAHWARPGTAVSPIAVVSAATLVSYALYTLWPDTVQKFGSARLAFTIPFVIFGLFRYLDLVYRHDKGGHPEQILLTDAPLLVDLVLYGATVFALLFLAHP